MTGTSESLVETPRNRNTYPLFSLFLHSLLCPPDDRVLLDIGKKARQELLTFFGSPTYYSQSQSYMISFRDGDVHLGQVRNVTLRDVEA